jgi:predicted permease
MDGFVHGVRQIFRRLGNTPMFTSVILLTLAAAVGANTAVFSVLEGVLLKPLPYPHPDELVGIWHTAPGLNISLLNMAPSNYFVYREQGKSFESMGLYQRDSVSVTGTGEPERVPALNVTDGTLPALGILPMLGRNFNKSDMLPANPDTVILSFGYWQRKFGGDPSLLGHVITADGTPREVIGIMAQEFHFLDTPEPGLILPIRLDRNKTNLGQFNYEGLARLKHGVTIEEANADIARMLPIVWASFPPPEGFTLDGFTRARVAPQIRPLKRDVIGDVGTLLWILMGSIGLVLLIACANIANLLLVRTEGRQHELVIRTALGASRRRIAGELLSESSVIGLLGSVLGLVLAYGALRLLVWLAPDLPRLSAIGIDSPVLVFTLAVSLLSSLLFGAMPVLKYTGARVGTSLREGGRALSQSRQRHRARGVLVVIQVGLSCVLLVGAVLMIRTFRALTHVTSGFQAPAEVQTLRIAIPEADVAEPEKVVRMQEEMLHRISAIPGVLSAALASSVPMDGGRWMDPVVAEDINQAEGKLTPLRRFKFASPGLFQTLGIRLIAGRDFTWTDIDERRPVAIISENFAREYWGEPAGALAKRIRVGTKDDWREIVGVVADVRDDGMNQKAPSIAYWPIFMNRFETGPVQIVRNIAFAIRTPRAGSESLMREVRQAVWSVDPSLPLTRVNTLDYYYSRSMARTSFTLTMLGIAAVLALLLGAVGLYGVIAYSVSQRTREIGIRGALGAQRQELTGMFVREGLLLAGTGIIGGLAAAFAATRLMSSLLFGVSTTDPLTYLVVCASLAGIAGFASYVPSRRAASVDPVESLRVE